jgi:NAD(P)-dependent dehydrogenase (short-subunit alcohol dehydrogenase family)
VSGRLQNKVALITGAGAIGPGWGNGRSEAVLFASEGASVFAVDRDLSALVETTEKIDAAGGTHAVGAFDVTDSGSVKAMVDACVERFGRIDILVNNVGGGGPIGGPVELSEEEWERQLKLNLTSIFLTCKHVLPIMEANGGGSIVNTSSSAAIRWTGQAQVAYAAAKAGVIAFSKIVAVQYAARKIRVNTVIPGQMHTPLVSSRLARNLAGGDLEALLAKRAARIPAGFMGDGRDIANAALYLASDEARFVTGTELIVDGGMTSRCD